MTFGNEPPIDPLADTSPSITMRPVDFDKDRLPLWRRVFGLVSLIGAAVLTLATIGIFATAGDNPNTVPNQEVLTAVPTNIPSTPTPTTQADTSPTQAPQTSGVLPTV